MGKNIPNRELTDEILACKRSNQNPNIVSDKLAGMLMSIVENFASKGNWRGYSYRDEFIAEALCHLVSPGVTKNDDGSLKNPVPAVLKFNENYVSANGQLNGFAYVTQIIKTTFLKTLRAQKKQAAIRDTIRMDLGLAPSHGVQQDNHDDYEAEVIEVEKPKRSTRLGRPK